MTRILNDHRFDVVHLHHSGVWLAAAAACKLARVPCLYTNHGGHARRTFLQHRIASVLTNAVAMLTPMDDPYISKWVGVSKDKLIVVPNGIDLERFASAERCEIEGVPADAVVIGMVARMNPPKDFAAYLRAAAVVAAKYPEVHFVAIGDGPNRAEYETLAHGLALGNVHFLGFRTDVPNLIKRMHVQVLSTRSEGLPLTLIEAMAGGGPSSGATFRPSGRSSMPGVGSSCLAAITAPWPRRSRAS